MPYCLRVIASVAAGSGLDEHPSTSLADGGDNWGSEDGRGCKVLRASLASASVACTAIPRAWPSAAFRIAPQSAERARGHTVAAIWLRSAERLALTTSQVVAFREVPNARKWGRQAGGQLAGRA